MELTLLLNRISGSACLPLKSGAFSNELSKGHSLSGQRVDHLKKGKSMEVGVPGANPAKPMFAHEDGSVGVVEQVAREMRQLGKNLSSHLGVP